MSVSLVYSAAMTVTEILANNPESYSASNRTVKSDQFNQSGTYNASSDVPATKHGSDEVTLSYGSGEIDLTALSGANGASVDGTGLKVQAILIIADEDNLADVTIDVGDTNGYELFGAAFSVTLSAGQHFLAFGNDDAPDVSSSAKILDLAGTGSDVVKYSIVLG